MANHDSLEEELPELRPLPLPPSGEIYYVVHNKRFGSEIHDLREFLTPGAAKVVEYAYDLYDSDRDNFILNCWDWVCMSFDYAKSDYHEMKAFVRRYRTWGVYRQRFDFWHFPAEMIGFYEDAEAWGRRAIGDCEDTSFLLASLLLCYTSGVWVNIGNFNNTLHAWVTVDRGGREYILETTLSDVPIAKLLQTDPWLPANEFPEFRPLYKFDHNTVIQLSPTT